MLITCILAIWLWSTVLGFEVGVYHNNIPIKDSLDFLDKIVDSSSTAVSDFQALQSDRYSSCQRKVLIPFLQRCVKFGVEGMTSEERMQIAVEMAICDFRAAKSPYPNSCSPEGTSDVTDATDCLSELIKSPSLYNAYHGYLLALGSVCREESKLYEKDQFIELFLNMAKVISKLVFDIKELLKHNEDHIQHFKNKVELTFSDLRDYTENEVQSMITTNMDKFDTFSGGIFLEYESRLSSLMASIVQQEEVLEKRSLSLFQSILNNLTEILRLSNTDEVQHYRSAIEKSFVSLQKLTSHLLASEEVAIENFSHRLQDLNSDIGEEFETAQELIMARSRYEDELNTRHLQEFDKLTEMISYLGEDIGDRFELISDSLVDLSFKVDDLSSPKGTFLHTTLQIIWVVWSMKLMDLLQLFICGIIASFGMDYLLDKAMNLHDTTNSSFHQKLSQTLVYILAVIALILGVSLSKMIFNYLT